MVTGDMTFISMFTLGLLGSGHCLGMCGPLVVALPGRFGNWRAHLAYHFGRIVTYTIIGALLGGIGSGFGVSTAPRLDPAMAGVRHLQLFMSGVAALFLLVFGLNRLGFVPEPAWLSTADPQKIPGLGRLMRRAFQANHVQFTALFGIGLILGLLPCGLSYAAFARALAGGGSLTGAVLILGFALGTLPGLLLLGTGAGHVLRRLRRQSDILAGLIMIAMALMIARKISSMLLTP